jgi:hypothetical protein
MVILSGKYHLVISVVIHDLAQLRIVVAAFQEEIVKSRSR